MADTDEAEIRTLLAGGDHAGATTAALRAYGPELIGWLSSFLQVDADAYDAFSIMSEELWKSIFRFDGRCSMRTWCYMLARHAMSRVLHPAGIRSREELVSQIPSVAELVTKMWSTTRRDAERADDVYAEVRASLPEDDRLLLVLRVDRDLAWRDIAQVMLGEQTTPEDVDRKAATLRKQFERVKERLRDAVAERIRD